ncbi:MAG TPA: recombinase family protein, partial [Tepidisphaeraceae bacterium]|nr:recombinase family protein [Tepidisphaeraceae bacterium]
MIAMKTGKKRKAHDRGDANGNRLVISYLRFSRPEQLKGDSVRRQLEASKKWAAERQLTIDESLTDYGISAYRGANADGDSALASFLRLCELDQIPRGSILLVESLDRLSRNALLEALELFLSIIRRGIKIVTLMDGQEYTSESLNQNMQGLMYSIMQMSLAHEESAKKASRLSDAWEQKRRTMDRTPLTGR